MKRFFAITLVLSMILVFCPFNSFAETYSGACGDNLTWSLDSKTGVLTISGEGEMYDYAWNTYVPWYDYNGSILCVVIEEGVTSIGDNAFYDCYDLTSIDIPENITSIGKGALGWCDSLKSIDIPDGVASIGRGAFEGCQSLTIIDIPDSVTAICDYTFYNCNYLTSVTIPNSIISIGEGAFEWCERLTSIDIPDSVTSIGEGAFWGCKSLSNVTIGDGVISISDSAFYYCDNLTTAYYSGTEEEWNAISIGDYNSRLLNAEIIFNYCPHDKSEWRVLEDGTKEKVCNNCGGILETLGADERIPNDINGDNNFNMFDYVTVKNAVIKGTADEKVSPYLDVNGDGKLNIFDYVAIKAAYFAK